MLAKSDRPALAKIDVFSLLLTRRQASAKRLTALVRAGAYKSPDGIREEARLDLLDELLGALT